MLNKETWELSSKYYNDPKSFIECSNKKHDIYKIIKNYNPRRQRKILIVFDGMIYGMISNKNFTQYQLNYSLEVQN